MDKDAKSIAQKNSWLFVAGGFFVGLIIVAIILKKAYCLYSYQPGGSTLIQGLAAVSAVLIGLIRFLFDRNNNLIPIESVKKLIYFLLAAIFTGCFVILISPLFLLYDRNSCVQDFNKLVALTDQEGLAVIKDDMGIIRQIYTPDAIVTRMDTGESSVAYTYYSIMFAQEEHCTNSHNDYLITNYSSNEVTMTTGSQGTWGMKGQGCTLSFSNPSGSDQWIFKKINGEWKIVNLEINRR